VPATNDSKRLLGSGNEQDCPGKNREQRYGKVEPEGLDVLEFRCEIALEIVLDDEDAKEVGIAAGAEKVPGESSEAEARDGHGMKAAKGVAPAFAQDGPGEKRARREDDRGGAFRENGEAKEKAQEHEGQPGSSRQDGRVFVAHESEDKRRRNHGDGEHRREGHVCGRSVRETDHADGGGQEEQQPSGRFGAVEAPGKPREGESCEQCGGGARKPSGGFVDAKELEAQSGAPIIEHGFLEPGLTVEARRDPVAGFHHVARDPRVTRLVGTHQANGTEVMEVGEVQSSEDQGHESKTRGEGRRVALEEGVVDLRHGTLSLAF